MVYRWIHRSVTIKQLQEFLKSDHWLRRYCILSGGVFYFEPPCTRHNTAEKNHTMTQIKTATEEAQRQHQFTTIISTEVTSAAVDKA